MTELYRNLYSDHSGGKLEIDNNKTILYVQKFKKHTLIGQGRKYNDNQNICYLKIIKYHL